MKKILTLLILILFCFSIAEAKNIRLRKPRTKIVYMYNLYDHFYFINTWKDYTEIYKPILGFNENLFYEKLEEPTWQLDKNVILEFNKNEPPTQYERMMDFSTQSNNDDYWIGFSFTQRFNWSK